MAAITDLESIRKDYRLQSLLEKDVDANPIQQFKIWWDQAVQSGIDEPNAMTLATSTPTGKPSARIVLLKAIRNNGFVFFTNYNSRKGQQVNDNPFVSLVFFWKELERQVRIEGEIKKINEQESDDYFSKRPMGSRIGAWSSPQSEVIKNRDVLDKNVSDSITRFSEQDIPRPPYWGGYIVNPTLIEFWQGRPGRLHDRLQYTIVEKTTWKIERLAP